MADNITTTAGVVATKEIAGAYRAVIADNLLAYVDGASVQWTDLDAGSIDYGILVEITGS